ncbi:hypothetical protein SNE40_016767 [Patella caerulea]
MSHDTIGLNITVGVLPQSRHIVQAVRKILPDLNLDLIYDFKLTGETFYDRIETVHSKLKSQNIQAVIGPYEETVAIATESVGVVYMSTTPVSRKSTEFMVQMIPSVADYCRALLALVIKNKWTKISVFYDSDAGVELLEKLTTNHMFVVRAWKLQVPATRTEVREALVKMRKFLVETSIVFCENKENINHLLTEARDLAMLSTSPYQWMFNDPGTGPNDRIFYEWIIYEPGDQFSNLLTKYQEIAVNFTVFNVLEFDSFNNSYAPDHDRMTFALMADAFMLLDETRKTLNPKNKLEKRKQRKSFMQKIKKNKLTGSTGDLRLDSEGKRSNIQINLTAITGPSYFLKGIWKSNPGEFETTLQLFPDSIDPNRTIPFPLRDRTVRVVTILERPFTMLKRDHESKRGIDKFEGFAVDLIEAIAKKLKFKYELYLVHDKKFGSRSEDGSWNGMIGELLAGNASMSVAPLSINSQREEAVDFTKPFMTRYITVLLRIPRRETSYFEFLNPLSPVVWICTLGAFLVVSIVLYGLERIGLKAKNPAKISMRESFWFIFGSLLQGNTDASPSTVPGRILTSAWWFFALILISSYTANLAAFLTVKKINTPIKSVTDLAQQTKIKYGTVADSGVMTFFKNTNIEHFSKMWAQMSEIEPDSLVQNTTVGYEKVKNEDYAFFWDTTVNRYKTIKDCNVMEIGPPFDPKGFGIGVPPGATYREELSMAILRLSDTGKLHELENKWWGSRNCPDLSKSSSDETSELQIDNVAGVFFILVGGICIAALVCLGEYLAHMIINAAKLGKPQAKPKEKENFL